MYSVPLLLRCLVFISTLSTTWASGPLVFSVAEEAPVGTEVGVVSGDTQDPVPAERRYRIRSSSSSSSRHFQLDEFSGLLRTAEILDREELCPYESFCELIVNVIGKYFDFFAGAVLARKFWGGGIAPSASSSPSPFSPFAETGKKYEKYELHIHVGLQLKSIISRVANSVMG